MFLAVWMLYAADRLLDARPLWRGVVDPAAELPLAKLAAAEMAAAELEDRHHFHYRHRKAFLAVIAAASPFVAVLLRRVAAPVRNPLFALAGVLACWLLVIHVPWGARSGGRRLPKEFAVGCFFSAATFAPTFVRLPPGSALLLYLGLMFAGLCSLNCLFLFRWEHPLRTRGRGRQLAQPGVAAYGLTRWCAQHVAGLALLLLAASALLAALARAAGNAGSLRHPAAIAVNCSLSTALLLVLHHRRRSMSSLRLRALADAVLLTPALWVIFVSFGMSR